LANETRLFIEDKGIIDVNQIKKFIEKKTLRPSISVSTVTRLLKNNIGARFHTLPHIHKDKNCERNKIYRKFTAKVIMNNLASADIFLSIDETSFSSLNQKTRHWVLNSGQSKLRRTKYKDHKNITLILAISKERVEGFCLVKGSMNQLVFCEFLSGILYRIRTDRRTADAKVTIHLDNLYAHRTLLLKTIFIKYNVFVIFNPPYTPELNFVENAFNDLKREYLKEKNVNKK